MNLTDYQKEIADKGYTILEDVFSEEEIHSVISCVDKIDASDAAFRKTNDLFAIRRFLEKVPDVVSFVFTDKFKALINDLFGAGFFVVKSIYFDKPKGSNWFVAYHQDLTISVDKKTNVSGFGPWSAKPGYFAVQPPLAMLERNFTIRIHLDDTDENNGALRVIPGSHLEGIYRATEMDRATVKEDICRVKAGGIMIMKPMLMHASGRAMSEHRRRVVHIEFSDQQLPQPLHWSEKMECIF